MFGVQCSFDREVTGRTLPCLEDLTCCTARCSTKKVPSGLHPKVKVHEGPGEYSWREAKAESSPRARTLVTNTVMLRSTKHCLLKIEGQHWAAKWAYEEGKGAIGGTVASRARTTVCKYRSWNCEAINPLYFGMPNELLHESIWVALFETNWFCGKCTLWETIAPVCALPPITLSKGTGELLLLIECLALPEAHFEARQITVTRVNEEAYVFFSTWEICCQEVHRLQNLHLEKANVFHVSQWVL